MQKGVVNTRPIHPTVGIVFSVIASLCWHSVWWQQYCKSRQH